MSFDAKKETQKCIDWISEWFNNRSGNAKGCVIGISGGKDSTVVAALLCKAIGKDKVLGIMMPNGEQKDIEDGKKICRYLDINSVVVNIQDSYNGILSGIDGAEKLSGSGDSGVFSHITLEDQPRVNIAPRLRMTTLYAMGQQLNYRIAGTGNLSERYVGYCTKWGDMANDFNAIGSFTSDEVMAIGACLGLPEDLVYKAPADGLTGKTDEENLGFTYATLNGYIRTGICKDAEAKEKIDRLHKYNGHKLLPISIYLMDQTDPALK